MRIRKFALAAGALTAGVVIGGDGIAETVLQRAACDGIKTIARGDPHMAAAMRQARATLAEFLSLVRSPPRTITSYSVKIGISEGDDMEYFWISPFREESDGLFVGRINNTPRTVTTVKYGQLITFKQEEIVDWLYREKGRMHGNFTACAILKHEPRDQAEAFMKRFGLRCAP